MLDTAIIAAKKAGEILTNQFGKVQTRYKTKYFDSASLVTEADLQAEETILSILERVFPSHNIFAEEKGMQDKGSEFAWYIDPLDGTSNFVRGLPLYGVSLGLVHEDQPILGVLYFPALDLLVHAEEGKGTIANGRAVRVSNRPLRESLYYARGYFRGQLDLQIPIAKKVGLVKMIDATSVELAQIAIGNAELYILQSVPHDVAAGVVIVREAGGNITEYDGSPWNITSKTIVASNGTIHEEVIPLLRKATIL